MHNNNIELRNSKLTLKKKLMNELTISNTWYPKFHLSSSFFSIKIREKKFGGQNNYLKTNMSLGIKIVLAKRITLTKINS